MISDRLDRVRDIIVAVLAGFQAACLQRVRAGRETGGSHHALSSYVFPAAQRLDQYCRLA
jgi:hypothetical protein